MKNKKTAMITGGVFLALIMFVGCGEHAGEKEYNKANAAWKKGDLVRARTLFEKSIRKSSDTEQKSLAWNQLGLILWQLDEIEAAAEAFSTSCNLTDTLSGANLNLAIALFHTGRLDESEVAFNNVLGNDPDNTTAQSMLGLIAMKKNNWSGAAQQIYKTARLQPNDPAGQTAMALANLHINRNSDAAVAQLKQTLSAHPDYAPAAYNLAVIYDKWLGNKSAAVSWYNQYLEKAGAEGAQVEVAQRAVAQLGGQSGSAPAAQTNPDAAAQFIAAGSKFHSEKKYAEAVEQYQKAVLADPRQKNAHYNMGLAYYALQQYNEAANACLNALQLDPKFANARYMLALSYVQQRKWNDAEKEERSLRQLDSASADIVRKFITDSRR